MDNYFDILGQNVPNEDKKEESLDMVNLTVRADAECAVFCDGDFLFTLEAGKLEKTQAPAGQHLLEFKSLEDDNIVVEKEVDFSDVKKNYLVIVRELSALIEQKKAEEAAKKATKETEAKRKAEAEAEAKRRAEEEAKRKAEEEAKRRAKEEAKRKAEAEAKHKAEEDARRRAEEDARRRAEEDARRRAEEDAKRRAEEDAKRRAEEDAKRKADEDAKRKGYIDLGLSVKWATFNVGAKKPEEYGDYFAWGETNTKRNYNWLTYKWCTGTPRNITKYNNKGIALDLVDDVAHVKRGGSWRLPTKIEIEELRKKCSWIWTSVNGVRGYRITSRVSGYTNRSIFLPAAGFIDDWGTKSVGSYGCYWLNSVESSYGMDTSYACSFGIKSEYAKLSCSSRCIGLTVRPVYP